MAKGSSAKFKSELMLFFLPLTGPNPVGGLTEDVIGIYGSESDSFHVYRCKACFLI